jgi:hypothetical protein
MMIQTRLSVPMHPICIPSALQPVYCCSQGIQSNGGSTLTIDLGSLPKDKLSKEHTIAVTVSKGSGDAARAAQASIKFTPEAGSFPTGRIQRYCGSDLLTGQPRQCPVKINPSEALSLLLLPDREYEAASVRWRLPDGAAVGYNLAGNADGAGTTSLVIKANSLPTGKAMLGDWQTPIQ